MTQHQVTLADEGFDAHIGRPIARVLGPWLHERGVHPDSVSYFGAIIGLAGGVAFAGHGLWPLVGMVLLLSMLIIDCVDGAIARLRPPGERPWRGRIIDGICDGITVLAVFGGMTVHLAGLNLTVSGYSLGGLEWAVIGSMTFLAFLFGTQGLDKAKHRLKPNSPDHRVAEFALQKKSLYEHFLFFFFANNITDMSYRAGDEERYRLLLGQGPTTRFVAASLAALLTAFYPSAFLVYFGLTWLMVLYVIAVEHRVRRDFGLPGHLQ